ncbi:MULTISPECIES: hypothetical protein [unclassified Paraburkholderia]|uniref:hypothetical protein n=1 Tax=unclassified Paraburkholderia TaxID=2615204 RepID=UPI002AB04BEC|nr:MULTISPECIES: hypothetical protein [unclassified Paraburkholderia]
MASQTLFELGFEHGAEAEEDPGKLEFCSRVREYQISFVVGRAFSTAVKQASHKTAALTAGALRVRYGLTLSDLLLALTLSQEDKRVVRAAYTDARLAT